MVGISLVRGLRESAFVAYLSLSLFILVSLVSFNLEDPGWIHGGNVEEISNSCGTIGAWLSDFLLTIFGLTAYLIPVLLIITGYKVMRGDSEGQDFTPAGIIDSILGWAGLVIALAASSALLDLHLINPPLLLPDTSGGILGSETVNLLGRSFGNLGTTILLTTLFLTGASLFTGLTLLGILDVFGSVALFLINALMAPFKGLMSGFSSNRDSYEEESEAEPVSGFSSEPAPLRRTPPPTARKNAKTASPPLAMKSRGIVKAADHPPLNPGELPTIDLLSNLAPKVKGYTQENLDKIKDELEEILNDFGVTVTVTDYFPGPVITRFELQPAAGVKVSRISGLAKDLARTLSVASVRVVEIIPGKTVIGIEIPNEERELVLLRSVLASEVYRTSHSPLTLVLGKDISGQPVVANLARMPHLLVAGTTGSGKSVAVNVMILSLLFKARPEDVRLIMIDPKMLELSIYEGIPHLLTPVVTDMKEAANALRWCVAEMERRYKLMSMMGVRNIAGLNQKISDATAAGEAILDPMWSPDMHLEGEEAPVLSSLPYIVIIIDELADMMMIVGKKVEELIARLAQKARASGIHLILATQRPSVDVITGLIKANIPTRIAFQVSSKIDSRTILDQGGAESLLGNGDMLYLPPGTGLPIRAHGAFVSDQEVHNVVEFLKLTGPADYIDEITRFTEDSMDSGNYKASGNGAADMGDELDSLYDEAVRFVTESRKASISSVQRRFKVGYNRAARMIEDMEKAGIVGAAETNGSREVLAPPPPSD